MSAFERIVAALEATGKVKRTARGARAQCPVHRSNGLTLSVTEGDDRASIQCFAGCDDTEVLAEIGLEVRDLFDHGAQRSGYLPPRRVRTPWEETMAGLGIHNPPPLEHVLDRMAYEHAKEDAAGCASCGTRPSPWSCSCGLTRVEHPGGVSR